MPLAHRSEDPCRSVVIVTGLLGLDVEIDGVRDGLVRPARFMLVVMAARSLSWPIRVIRARKLAPLEAANEFPAWRRSGRGQV